jgi:hypothetical protein
VIRAILQRCESTDEGTFGRLSVKGVDFFSGELPWRNNASNISCIPSGIYRVKWTLSPRFKRFMYLVTEVKSRSGIRFHSANLCGDKSLGLRCQLNGCISLGQNIGFIDGQRALLFSKPAIRRFEKLLDKQDFDLEIRDA